MRTHKTYFRIQHFMAVTYFWLFMVTVNVLLPICVSFHVNFELLEWWIESMNGRNNRTTHRVCRNLKVFDQSICLTGLSSDQMTKIHKRKCKCVSYEFSLTILGLFSFWEQIKCRPAIVCVCASLWPRSWIEMGLVSGRSGKIKWIRRN